MNQQSQQDALFSRGSYAETSCISEIMRKKSVGGFILLAATVLAFILANSQAAHFYESMRDTELGFNIPGFSHLMMNVHLWAPFCPLPSVPSCLLWLSSMT